MDESSSGVEFGSDRWKELVEIGRKAHDSAAWIIGDALLEIEPMGEAWVSGSGSGDRIRLYAAEIGAAYGTAKSWREMARYWPKDKRNPINAYSVHRHLRSHPRRFDLIKSKMTEGQARQIMAEHREENPMTANRAFTTAEESRIAEEYANGAPKGELVQRYGVDRKTINRAIERANKPERGRRTAEPKGLFRKITVGLTPEQYEWIDTLTRVQELSESGYIRDLIDEDMRRARRRKTA